MSGALILFTADLTTWISPALGFKIGPATFMAILLNSTPEVQMRNKFVKNHCS